MQLVGFHHLERKRNNTVLIWNVKNFFIEVLTLQSNIFKASLRKTKKGRTDDKKEGSLNVYIQSKHPKHRNNPTPLHFPTFSLFESTRKEPIKIAAWQRTLKRIRRGQFQFHESQVSLFNLVGSGSSKFSSGQNEFYEFVPNSWT